MDDLRHSLASQSKSLKFYCKLLNTHNSPRYGRIKAYRTANSFWVRGDKQIVSKPIIGLRDSVAVFGIKREIM